MSEEVQLSCQIHGLAAATWTPSTENSEVRADIVENSMIGDACHWDKCPTPVILDIMENNTHDHLIIHVRHCGDFALFVFIFVTINQTSSLLLIPMRLVMHWLSQILYTLWKSLSR